MKKKTTQSQDTVSWKKKDVKEYLDSCIRFWRKKREVAKAKKDGTLIADCYVDAYQSVRSSLFGELLLKE